MNAAQRHRDQLLPPLVDPPAELLAQAALFLALRDQPPVPPNATPWVRMSARRFGGDVHTRTIQLETETSTSVSVHISTRPSPSGRGVVYDITTPTAQYRDVSAELASPTSLTATLAGALMRTTVVAQPHGAAGAERLHIFSGSHATTVLRRAPAWAEELSADVHTAAAGALRAPMPSLVVEVRVEVGQRVEKGQVVVVLESMKTETVLRAPADGVVRAVGCAKGEMVEEGRELVDIEEGVEDNA
jgi:3-methylcrotonyl-CoA carboxylase alpha subunit